MSSVNSFDVYSQLETLANQGGQNQTQDGIGLTYNSSVGGTGVGNGGGGGGTGPGGSNGGGGNGNGDDMDSGRWMYGAPRGSVDNVFAGTSGNSYFLAQSAAAANAENEDAIVCGSQCSACERCVNYCDNDQEGARPFNLHIKFICLLLIVYAGFVVATGRGIFSILQGIGGVIFAIEGGLYIKIIYLVCYYSLSYMVLYSIVYFFVNYLFISISLYPFIYIYIYRFMEFCPFLPSWYP